MTPTIESLVQGAKELPPDQRFTLAQRILASVEPEEAPVIGAAWEAEIRERIRLYDEEGTRGIPAAEVFDRIDRSLGK